MSTGYVVVTLVGAAMVAFSAGFSPRQVGGAALDRSPHSTLVVALARYGQGRRGGRSAVRAVRDGHRCHRRNRPGAVFDRCRHHRGQGALVFARPIPAAMRRRWSLPWRSGSPLELISYREPGSAMLI